MKLIKRSKRFFLCILVSFFLWLLWSLGGICLDKLANWDNEKYMYGGSIYSEKEVNEYFNNHKEELNQIAELITSKCKYRETGQLDVGISVFRHIEFFDRHKYIVRKYQYATDLNTGEKQLGVFKKKYFTEEEVKILNELTDHYCNIISMETMYEGMTSSKPYLRFVFRSWSFSTIQQLVYMPDGGEFKTNAGDVTHLEGNWYYHRNTLI